MNLVASYFPFYERALSSSSRVVGVDSGRILFAREALIENIFKSLIAQAGAPVPLPEIDPSGLSTETKTSGPSDIFFLPLINSILQEISVPIEFHLIEPYGIYIPQLSQVEMGILYYVLFQGGGLPASVDQVLRIRRTDNGKTKRIDGKVTIYDYSTIVDEIEFVDESGIPIEAIYNAEGGLLKEPVPKDISVGFLTSLNRMQGNADFNFLTTLTSPMVDPKQGQIRIHDDYDLDKMAKEISGTTRSLKTVGSGIERVIETIFASDQKGIHGVPCLTGLSGVAKSALIKGIVEKNGYRMVDFRSAFLHRLDMEGMFVQVDETGKVIPQNDFTVGQKFTRQAYLGDFVKASDQYQAFAIGMVARLQEILAGEGEFADYKEQLKESGELEKVAQAIEKFREESRPCVLFFEEIIRAKLKILNLFTILLDQKEFESLTFHKAKIVASANTPHGLSNMEEGVALFIGQEVGDPAIFERLKIIPVEPLDVYPSFIENAKEKGWHKDILSFLDNSIFGMDRSYDLKFLSRADVDIDTKRNASYATFRAWEMVDKLMQRYIQDETLFENSIRGWLGKTEICDEFIDHLTREGIVFSTETKFDGIKAADDSMYTVLESNIESGIPTGLFGASGMGKTARVSTIVATHGFIPMVFQMSQQSASDVMGVPHVISIETFLFEEAFKEIPFFKEDEILKGIARDIVSTIEGLPSHVTLRAPKSEIKDKIDRVKAMRKAGLRTKLVLIFEEVNRIAEGSESIQSAVFEAISDNRFAGIDFDPDELSVVCTGNVNIQENDGQGDMGQDVDPIAEQLAAAFGEKPSYAGAKDIDAALRLRLCAIDKNVLGPEDAIATKKWILDYGDFHPVMKEFFREMPLDKILLFMRATEYKSIFHNVPSIRSFDSLSKVLESHSAKMSGKWFFPQSGSVARMMVERSTLESEKAFVYLMDLLNKPEIISNWVGLGYGDIVRFSIANVTTTRDLMVLLSQLINIPKSDVEVPESLRSVLLRVVDMVSAIEEKIREERLQLVTTFVGSKIGQTDVGNDFVSFFNERMSDVENIGIEGIIDKKTAEQWFEKVVRLQPLPDKIIDDYLDPCLTYLGGPSGRRNCIIFVIQAIVNKSESTVAEYLLKNLIDHRVVFENDSYFSQFNKIVADFIRLSRLTMGPEWDVLVKEL